MDANELQKLGLSLMRSGRRSDALKIWFHMAEGDPSLDGGALGHVIGECYEELGDLHAARYWYSRALEENPDVQEYKTNCARLEHVNIDNIK